MTKPREPKKISESGRARAQDEAFGVDQEKMAKFMREHEGMTPIQFALSIFPSKAVEKAFPELVPQRKKKPPPVGNG